jgi:hypothetical protein
MVLKDTYLSDSTAIFSTVWADEEMKKKEENKRLPNKLLKGDFEYFLKLNFNLLHLPPLRFYCVGGC